MPQAAYPAAADLAARLGAAGYSLTPEQWALLAQQAAAAAAEFERRVDLLPFLAEASPTTRQVDPPINRAGILILDRPALSITQIAYQPQGDTSTTLIAGTEWNALPVAAGGDGRPYTQIQFSAPQWYGPLGYPFRGALYVTGRWGAFGTVPDDAWEGIAARGCLRAYPLLRQAQTEGVQTVSRPGEQGASLTWAAGSPLVEEWKAAWQSAVAAYRDVGL
jgi:hypothetical protein